MAQREGEKEISPAEIIKGLQAGTGSVEVLAKSAEHSEDRAQRHRIEELRLRHEQMIELIGVGFGLLVVAGILAFSMIVGTRASDQDTRKTILAFTPSVLTAVLGFAAGRGSSRKKEG
jgi:hypothetical protein